MADEITPQAQAADEPTPTATEQAPATVETQTPTLTQDPAAPAPVAVEGMDERAYADMAKQLREVGLPPEAEAPAAAPAPAATPAKTGEVTPKVDPDDEGGDAPKRIRITDLDRVEREAVILVRDMRKEGTPISLAEAEGRIKAKYGITDTKPAEQTPATEQTPEALQARLAELMEAEEKAASDVDTVAQLKAGREIRAVEKQLAEANTARQTAAQRVEEARAERANEMRKLFPDFKDENSPLAKEWAKIHEEMQATNHPILSDPAEATEFITLKAARRLGISPVTSKPAAAAKAPSSISPAVTKVAPPVRPASGAARTATPSAATGQIEQLIDGATNLREYEQLKAVMLAAG